MPFEITPNVDVRRDREGRVRQLSHSQPPYRPSNLETVTSGPVLAARLIPLDNDLALRTMAP